MTTTTQFRDPRLPVFRTIEEAAVVLATKPKALRAQCRRALKRMPYGSTAAPLAAGIWAIKLGRRWRIRFDFM